MRVNGCQHLWVASCSPWNSGEESMIAMIDNRDSPTKLGTFPYYVVAAGSPPPAFGISTELGLDPNQLVSFPARKYANFLDQALREDCRWWMGVVKLAADKLVEGNPASGLLPPLRNTKKWTDSLLNQCGWEWFNILTWGVVWAHRWNRERSKVDRQILRLNCNYWLCIVVQLVLFCPKGSFLLQL